MASIQPFQVWNNGSNVTVSELNVKISYDNLSSTATFYYELKEADTITEENVIQGRIAASGSMSMSGEDYINWDDSNAAAYAWVADKINVVLV